MADCRNLFWLVFLEFGAWLDEIFATEAILWLSYIAWVFTKVEVGISHEPNNTIQYDKRGQVIHNVIDDA